MSNFVSKRDFTKEEWSSHSTEVLRAIVPKQVHPEDRNEFIANRERLGYDHEDCLKKWLDRIRAEVEGGERRRKKELKISLLLLAAFLSIILWKTIS